MSSKMARIKWVDADTVLDVLYQKKGELQLFDNTQAEDYIMQGLNIAEDVIRHTNADDVAPVRHGRWEMKPDPFGFFDEIPVCSECGCITKMRDKPAYCPHCKAKMDQGDNDGEEVD